MLVESKVMILWYPMKCRFNWRQTYFEQFGRRPLLYLFGSNLYLQNMKPLKINFLITYKKMQHNSNWSETSPVMQNRGLAWDHKLINLSSSRRFSEVKLDFFNFSFGRIKERGWRRGIANGQDMKINCKKILWFIMTDNERWDYLTRQLDRQALGQTDRYGWMEKYLKIKDPTFNSHPWMGHHQKSYKERSAAENELMTTVDAKGYRCCGWHWG